MTTSDQVARGTAADALLAQRSLIGSWGHRAPDRTRLVKRWASGRVIDIGCAGDAYLAPLEAEGARTFGVDMLVPDRRPMRFCIADGASLPFRSGSFDTALLFEVLEHVPEPIAMLSEIGRSSDRVVLSVPNCVQPREFAWSGLAFHHWVDRTHVNFYDPELLRSHLESAGWTVDTIERINPIAPETLALTSWRIPHQLARLIGMLVKRLPLRRKYFMTLAAVAHRPVHEHS